MCIILWIILNVKHKRNNKEKNIQRDVTDRRSQAGQTDLGIKRNFLIFLSADADLWKPQKQFLHFTAVQCYD